MNLSIEAKVVVVVAIAFAALSIGAIAQEQCEHRTSGAGEYAVTSSQLSLQESENTSSRYNEGSAGRLLAQY